MTESTHDVPRRLVDYRGAAEHFGTSPRTIEKWVSKGRIPAHKLGGHLVRIDLDEAEAALLTRREVG